MRRQRWVRWASNVGTLPIALVLCTAGLEGRAYAAAAGASAAAVTSSEVTSSEVTSGEVTSGGETQIVVLRSGVVLRSKAEHLADGSVRVHMRRGGVREIPAALVESCRAEAEVLREWKAAQRKGALTPAQELAWLHDAGLHAEGFGRADVVLDEAPHSAKLRAEAARLGRHALPRDAEATALLDSAAHGGRAVREAVLQRLPASAPRAELLKLLQARVRVADHGQRGFALTALGRLFPEEDARLHLLHALHDPSPAARIDAARALGDIGAGEVASPLVRALWSQSPAIRARAALALGETGAPEAVEPLLDRYFALRAPRKPKAAVSRPIAAPPSASAKGAPQRAYAFFGRQRAYIQDFDVEVASASSVADPSINVLTEGSVLDVGVISVTEVTLLEERRIVLRGLQRTTGAQLGKSPDAWRTWWDTDAARPFRLPARDQR